jgi:hypothetical protein
MTCFDAAIVRTYVIDDYKVIKNNGMNERGLLAR